MTTMLLMALIKQFKVLPAAQEVPMAPSAATATAVMTFHALFSIIADPGSEFISIGWKTFRLTYSPMA